MKKLFRRFAVKTFLIVLVRLAFVPFTPIQALQLFLLLAALVAGLTLDLIISGDWGAPIEPPQKVPRV